MAQAQAQQQSDSGRHIVAEFMDLFSGNTVNYGVHQYNFSGEGKEAGKSWTETRKLVTMELYKDHLAGKQGLGIIPINETGECKFGVIDIDLYDDSVDPYLAAIEHAGMPLVPFKSKSGGLHLYLFVKQSANASAIVEILQRFVVLLGLDILVKRKLNRIVEVFPKQQKTTAADPGNWINLPYYNAEKTRQHALRDGKALSLGDALALAKDRRRTLTELRTFLNDAAGADGPPCLQTINLLGDLGENSGRNNYLFSFGVYLKKKDPDFWEQKLFEINESLAVPISKQELEGTIISSLRKKDYAYKCLDAPCVDFCRKPLCKTRDFGIGKDGGYFSGLEYGKLVQIKSSAPYYEWEVKLPGEEKAKILRFQSEADIIGQDAFLRLCFRELKVLPAKLKQTEWYRLINQALAEMEVKVVAQEDETSVLGLFRSLFTEFLTGRAMAQTKAQILNKKVYYEEGSKQYFFRAQDLADFVFTARSFRYYSPNELHGLMRDMHARPGKLRTEQGRQLRVYALRQADLDNMGSMQDVPPFEAEFEAEDKEF